MILQKYLDQFSSIKMNPANGYKSPHKVCLLMAVMKGVEHDRIKSNRIYLNDDLIEEFKREFQVLRKVKDNPDISQPFFYLESAEFWHHQVYESEKTEYKQRTRQGARKHGGIGVVRRLVEFAYLDSALFELFKSQTAREALKLALMSQLDKEQKAKILVPEKGWSWEECEVIVKDYFSMLELDLKGTKYNKAEHNRRLQQVLLGTRSKGAIEMKHQNISAILKEIGMPIIDGYKPLSAYQRQILPDVVGAVLANSESLTGYIQDMTNQIIIPDMSNILDRLVDKPTLSKKQQTVSDNSAKKAYFPKPKNYLEEEAKNQKLGMAGEKFVIEYEKKRLVQLGKESLADKIEHTSTQDDSAGFDILSFEENGKEKYIEVKTTNQDVYTRFFVSPNELKTSKKYKEKYHLYRVFNLNRAPGLYVASGAIDSSFTLTPANYAANVK